MPHNAIEASYLDIFRNADAKVVCSPWSYDVNSELEQRIDTYVWNHPDFLPIFPSGNGIATTREGSQAQSPCSAKNVLCVGASYNARSMLLGRDRERSWRRGWLGFLLLLVCVCVCSLPRVVFLCFTSEADVSTRHCFGFGLQI